MQRFGVSIDVLGPILSRGLEPGSFGVDAVAARDAEGRIYLAGSHILGKVRDALSTLNACKPGWLPAAWEQEWFGGRGDETEGEARGRVFLGDLRPDHPPDDDTRISRRTRSRIAIDPVTGTALEGALQVMEQPYRSGEAVTFSGTLTILGADATVVRDAVHRALLWIGNAGGLRTIGFGRVVGAQVGTAHPQSAASPVPGQRLMLTLTFEEPFCIATRRIAENIYEGIDVVPGGAIKGALAAQLARDGGFDLKNLEIAPGPHPTLRKHFARIHVTHAFPVDSSTPGAARPCVRPVSLGYCDAMQAVRDFALSDGTALVGGQAPAFAPDFKDDGRAAGAVWPWPAVARDLRIHTAMDARLRAGKPQALFALEARAVHAHRWVATIDLDGVPAVDRGALANELQAALARGLAGIGRTHAFASVQFGAPGPVGSVAAKPTHVLVLQTPALLRRPDLGGDAGDAASERLKAAYDAVFGELSGGALALERLFVRERLSGASFIAARFFPNRPYRPFLLTEEGSTFVLKEMHSGASAVLQSWTRHGIPLATSVVRDYEIRLPAEYDPSSPEADDSSVWAQLPYLRQNGYGEAIVDDPRHARHVAADLETNVVASA